MVLVHQAVCCDGSFFGLISLVKDYFDPADVDIGGHQIADALMISAMVVVIDKLANRVLKGIR